VGQKPEAWAEGPIISRHSGRGACAHTRHFEAEGSRASRTNGDWQRAHAWGYGRAAAGRHWATTWGVDEKLAASAHRRRRSPAARACCVVSEPRHQTGPEKTAGASSRRAQTVVAGLRAQGWRQTARRAQQAAHLWKVWPQPSSLVSVFVLFSSCRGRKSAGRARIVSARQQQQQRSTRPQQQHPPPGRLRTFP